MGVAVMAVLLLVVMPVLLYLIGWGVTRYTRKAPGWIGLPVVTKPPSGKPTGKPPARIGP